MMVPAGDEGRDAMRLELWQADTPSLDIHTHSTASADVLPSTV